MTNDLRLCLSLYVLADDRTEHIADKDEHYNPHIFMAGPALTIPTDAKAVRRRTKAEILACIMDFLAWGALNE
jgi:hypothetical protein